MTSEKQKNETTSEYNLNMLDVKSDKQPEI